MSVVHNRDARAFGDWLRCERELRDVELRAIADETKIPKRFFEALEQGRLSVLPGGVFPRSFLRQYADYLGLDSDRLVDELDVLLAEPDEPVRRPSMSQYLREHRANLALVAILAAVGVLAFLKVRSEHSAAAFESPAATAATARRAPAPPHADRVYPQTPPAEAIPQEAIRHDRLRLALTAREPSWVAVTVDGQTVIDRILSRGESQTFEAAGEIVLSVGNAGGVTFTVNDQPGIALGRMGQVRRNIQINRQSLSAFVQNTPAALHAAQSG